MLFGAWVCLLCPLPQPLMYVTVPRAPDTVYRFLSFHLCTVVLTQYFPYSVFQCKEISNITNIQGLPFTVTSIWGRFMLFYLLNKRMCYHFWSPVLLIPVLVSLGFLSFLHWVFCGQVPFPDLVFGVTSSFGPVFWTFWLWGWETTGPFLGAVAPWPAWDPSLCGVSPEWWALHTPSHGVGVVRGSLGPAESLEG